VNRDVDGLPCVLIDSGAGVRQAFDHLVELGHESIVYLSGPAASWSDSQRRRALQAAAQAHGVRLTVLSHRRPEPDGGRQAVPELLEAGATAVIAFDDLLAQGLLTGLAEQGLRVPQDMSVIGCDDTIARFTTPPLTSVQSQTAEAGTRAVAMLTNKPPSAGAGPAERLYVGSSLIVRGTTGHRRHPHPVARMHSAL
jgi:LacI family transcriptional regulator